MSSSASSKVTDTPSRANPNAVINPTGPAPTIRTSAMPSSYLLLCRRRILLGASRDFSERAGIGAAVDQNILSGDVAGLHGTQEGAGCAEFVGVPEPFGGVRGPDLLRHLADATGGIPGQCRQVRF